MRFVTALFSLTVCLLVLVNAANAGRHGPSRAEKVLATKRASVDNLYTKRSSKKSSSSHSGGYHGTATWFTPSKEGGSDAACGGTEADNALIVALNAPQYGSTSKKSQWCGKKISITGPAGTATATIKDACPECKSGDLDLTARVFKKVVGDLDTGVGKISWKLV